MESKMTAPSSPEVGAYNPQLLPPRLEALPQPNQLETTPEKAIPIERATAPASGGALPMPTLPVSNAQSTQPVVPVLRPLAGDDNPATASDEEVIEKEWVDKAKKIIIQTKDDPYKQEKEVSKLQADYLKKRYGKDVKVAED